MIKANEVKAIVSAYNKNKVYKVDDSVFIDHAKRYIKAIKEGRILCSIESVAPSGMSRVIKFVEVSKYSDRKQYAVLNFYQFFVMLGFSPAGKYKNGFRVNGCGMDMVFHTNYSIIHKLHRLGFITKKQCDELAQKTPHVI